MPLRIHRESTEECRPAHGLKLVEPALPLERILTSGGDGRLTVASDQRNSYGCTPYPRPSVLDFGSSTASNISGDAYARVQSAQAQMWLDTARLGASPAMEAGFELTRHRLRNLLGVTGAEIVFSPSGTDSQLQMLFLATTLLGRPLVTIIAGSDQTGSGTAHTARGNHFGDRTSMGIDVTKGTPVAENSGAVQSISVPFCHPDGHLRTAIEMDGAIFAAVAQAVGNGNKVLLQAMDSSKLGWRAPSTACLDHIAAAWPDQVWVVVDACQMRASREALKDYLAREYFVLLTGSKFFTGPAFSGALLIPQSRAASVDASCVPMDTLASYTTRHDWPPQWRDLRGALSARCNHGQWLRWEAALHEMEAFFAVPPAFRRELFQTLACRIPAIISGSPNLALVAKPPCAANILENAEPTTIFPFVPHRTGNALSPEQCADLYRAMGQDLSRRLSPDAPDADRRVARLLCEIGQPVALGHTPGAALRICTSARHASNQWKRAQSVEDAVQSVLADLYLMMEKLEWLIASPQLWEGY